MIRSAALLLLPLLATGSDPLADRIMGPPAQCITLSQLEGPTITEDGQILYRQNGRRTWRANVIGRCPNLRPLKTLITEVRGNQLCRNDRFRLLEPGLSIPGPYCRFGSFTPFDKR